MWGTRKLNSLSGSQEIMCPSQTGNALSWANLWKLSKWIVQENKGKLCYPFWPSLWSHSHHCAIFYWSCKSVPIQWVLTLHKDINTSRRWRPLGPMLATDRHKSIQSSEFWIIDTIFKFVRFSHYKWANPQVTNNYVTWKEQPEKSLLLLLLKEFVVSGNCLIIFWC